MPYFKWVGVDITGATRKGKKSARCLDDLSRRLLGQGIALLHSKSLYTPSFRWKIDAKIKSDLFKQKAKLLRAGVLLPNVLEVIAQKSSNPIMHDILLSTAEDIQQGVSLGNALKKYHILHDPIVVVMLAAGHESGNLVNAVENVALYFHKQYLFNKNLRSALAMPLLTLLFFTGISFFIFIFIIPCFADMFSSLGQELPALTRHMISISEWVSSYRMIYIAVLLTIIVIGVQRYITTLGGKKKLSALISRLPFVGTIMWQYYMCQALQALSLLVASGTPLVVALKIVSESIDHEQIKLTMQHIHHDVAGGQLLSNAMTASALFLPEVIALVHIGQESGALGDSLEAAALVYNDTVEESLNRFVFFLQPIVIVLLGVFVTVLIFAVYSPIMQLSYVI